MAKSDEPKNFVPEKQISIDAEHTLEQLTGRFQGVKDGLPELIKNSKDHYSRLKITEKSERQIIILVSPDKKNLGVLDFAGAALEDFVGWRTWSSRTANRKHLAEDIEAGYGNGGKAFMVRGCSKMSSMCGYINGKINKWGFINNDPKLKFREGIFKNKSGKEMKDVQYSAGAPLLEYELNEFGLDIKDLPKDAQEIFKKRNSFTFLSLVGIRDWDGLNELNKMRTIHHIATDLMEHAQASLTIETCTVRVMMGKKLLFPTPLEVSDLTPFESLESPHEFQIPSKLIDPDTEAEIKLEFKDKEKNKLTIKTSTQNLRLSDRLKPRNVVRVRNKRNIVANWLMPDLVSLSSSAFMYGTIHCELLEGEYLTGPDRLALVDKPLTRALKHWTSEKAMEVAKKIQKLQSSRNTEEEKSSASETLQKLREIMNQFLSKDVEEGEEGTGTGGDQKKKKKKRKYGTKIDGIGIEPFGKLLKIAEGSTIPIVYWCYEVVNGKKIPVKEKHLVLVTEPDDIIDWVDESYIKGIKPGSTKIYFQTQDGKIKSDTIEIIVMEVSSLKINPINSILKQGETVKMDIEAYDKNNKKIGGVMLGGLLYEAHVDETEMGKINRMGYFTAGGLQGSATVRIKWGHKDDQVSVSVVQIGNEKIAGKEGGSKGKGAPLILLCGTPAPGREDLPQESRTLDGGEDYPTIIDYDPLWENIIWLNHNSHESKKVKMRGEGGTIKISSRTFRQFLALKCFEILKRLKVEETFKDNLINMYQFKQAIADAEMQTAGFLEKAYEIVKELTAEEEDED